MGKRTGWIAIVDGLDKDELLRNGFPHKAVVACAVDFMLDRPEKGYETFCFCMNVWAGWRQTGVAVRKSAWREAQKSVQALG
jgi:hypothetical protein